MYDVLIAAGFFSIIIAIGFLLDIHDSKIDKKVFK